MSAHELDVEDGLLEPARPVASSAGVLVLLMSTVSVEGLRRVAQAWSGPVLVVGSASEARAVIGGDRAAPPEVPDADPAGPGEVGAAEPVAGPGVGAPSRPAHSTGGLGLDPDRQVVRHRDLEAALTPLEFGLLSALLERPGRVRRFEQLTEQVWGTRHIGDAAAVHSVVKRLRRKLDDLCAPVQLQAVRGIGFRLVERPALSVVET